MKKTLLLSLAAAGALLATGVAEARVAWSIGIDAPGVATVVSNGPVYGEAPVYVAPPAVYAPVPTYRPAPVLYSPVPRYEPPPVVRYVPAPAAYDAPVPIYRPAPVVVYPEFHRWGWHRWEHRRDERWEHGDGRWDGRR